MYGATKIMRKDTMEIYKRIAERLHVSTRALKNYYLPYFKILASNKKWKENFVKVFNLTEEEMKMILK